MKIIFTVISFFITFTSLSQHYKFDTSSTLYYFENDIINEVYERKNITLPRPNIPADSFYEYLYSKAIYPELAINNYLEAIVQLSTTFDSDGKIVGIELKSEPYQLFDTAAIKLIMSTKNYWKAGTVDNKKSESVVDIYVRYRIEFISGKLYFTILPFLNTVKLYCASTSNFPALLNLQDENKNNNLYIKSKYQDASRLLLLRDDYGAVSLGFNIDTNGSISDITFINNVHSKLDSDAIKFIRSTDKKWIPAIKNGVKRNSHKEFDIMYFQTKQGDFINPVFSFIGNYNLSSIIDFHLAKELFTKKEYKQCIAKLNIVSKFDIHNPEVFYYRGLTHINLGDAEKGCEDIIYAKYLAEQYGYPIIMEKEKIDTFLKSSCGVE